MTSILNEIHNAPLLLFFSRNYENHSETFELQPDFTGALLLEFITIIFFSPHPAWANETWNAAPVNSDWNTAANWTPALVPGEGDIASFNVSNITAISNSADAAVFGIVFNPGASTYTFTASALHLLTFTASGVTNNSGVIQQFVSQPDAEGNPGAINFTGPSTAGTQTSFVAGAPTTTSGSGGSVEFVDTAAAGSGSFTNEGSALSGMVGGGTVFFFQSMADHGYFLNLPGEVSGATGGSTVFYSSSKGGCAIITSNGAAVSGAGGGTTMFKDTSGAESATLIANGGSNGGKGGLIEFESRSTGDSARVEVFGSGNLDVGVRTPG